MENNACYVECCSAGERTGLYYSCVNSYLAPDEVAYILDNSGSKVLITSAAKRDVALKAMAQCLRIVDDLGDGHRVVDLDWRRVDFPTRRSLTNPWVSSRSAMSAMSTKTGTFI
jgi:long-chain acyl-CoA synthetase